MRLGISIIGQYMGAKADEGFGAQLRIRTGEPYTRNGELKPGREENLDYFPFSPKTGLPSLPEGLFEGVTYVVAEVTAKAKGYRSADRGVSGMTVFSLEGLRIITAKEFEKLAAEDLLTEMASEVS